MANANVNFEVQRIEKANKKKLRSMLREVFQR